MLFEIIRLEFEDPNDFGVHEARQKIHNEWKGPRWVFNDANERIDAEKRSPSWTNRIVLAIFVTVWFLVGLISLGWFWPPQVREFLFCPSIPDERDGHQKSSFHQNSYAS